MWVVGDDTECVVIDAAHDAEADPARRRARRKVLAILCTHAHDDHITAVGEVADATSAPSYLHPADRVLWDTVYPVTPRTASSPTATSSPSAASTCGCCTPPATPSAPAASTHPTSGAVFTGDTLFQGGPGATGRSFSDFPTIIDSIRDKLLTLPPETVVHTGHGDDTTIGAEQPHLQEWIARGH